MRSIKKLLKKIVGRSTLSLDQLGTILVKIAGVVNSSFRFDLQATNYLNPERSQVSPKGCNKRPIAIGDLVLLKNDSTSRAFWKLGKVEELIPARDGNVRVAVVKVGSDSGHASHLRRVIQQLVPIEVKVQPETTCTPTNEVQAVNQNARPRCATAATGEALRRELNIVLIS